MNKLDSSVNDLFCSAAFLLLHFNGPRAERYRVCVYLSFVLSLGLNDESPINKPIICECGHWDDECQCLRMSVSVRSLVR